MEHILKSYYENGAKKLHKFVNELFYSKFGGIADKDMDEFYSVAGDVLTDIVIHNRFDPSKGNFEGYFYKSLNKAVIDEFKRQHRDKRCTKINVIDENGNNVLDENGKPKRISVPDVSIDAPLKDSENMSIGDTLQSDFDMDAKLNECMGGIGDERVEMFLDNLPKVQRQIVEMKMEEIPVSLIKKRLDLTQKQYEDNMNAIRENRMISLFNKSNKMKPSHRKGEEISMRISDETVFDNMLGIDTTDSYRMDKLTLSTLLDDKASGEIDCNYISQRQAFQWDESQINKFYSRILNNQPIPEIVICETVEDGEKISYLIDGLQRLSYAEEFRENRMPVKAKGAEFVNIQYKDFEVDEKGNPVKDENGRIKFNIKVINIIGKYYRDLPLFLQKRFDNFNINVTRYFNCTHDLIDYHIRNYNNHVGMTKAQYAATNVSNKASRSIKQLSEQHPFFKNNVNCTNKNRKKGILDECVARSMMTMYFMDDYKKETVDVFKLIDTHATEKQFDRLKDNLDRLAKVADKSVQNLFSTTNTYIWLAVFDKFTETGIEDYKFIEFMREFKDSLHSKNINGRSYESVNSKSTKDKSIVVGKIDMITLLMYDYFGIDKNEFKTIDIMKFVKNNVSDAVTEEDIDQYEEVLDSLAEKASIPRKFLDRCNRPSLTAIVSYSFMNDVDLDEWAVSFFKRNDTYIDDQKENYIHMKADLDKFILNSNEKSA